MAKYALWPWLIIVLLGSLPLLVLLGAGAWWLWQQQLFWQWISLSLGCGGLVWIAARLLSRRRPTSPFVSPIQKDTPFSERDQQAWQAVETLAEQIKQQDKLDLDQAESWLGLGRRVLAEVARHYRPDAKNPELEIPATELLRIVEQVSHDLHRQMRDHLPFSHLITLADGLNLHNWIDRLSHAHTVVRLSRMVLNPLAGVLSETGGYAQGKALALTLPHLRNWLLDNYLQKIGYYAILLYSGRMAVEADKIDRISDKSRQNHRQTEAQHERLEQEPLRILVAGQTNAGKSTLINTLFDSPRAATDVVSCTEELTPYRLDRNDRLSGLIFDTPGYGEQSNWLERNRDELDKTDLVLLLCDANNAARAADLHFLQAFRHHFQAHPNRKQPPLLLVVTHIDQLRPLREWQPPYEIAQPENPKAKNIRAAVDAIQQDLALPHNTAIVPVSLSDNGGLGPYNVDALLVAMGQQIDEAQQARLLRCLKDAQDKEKWTQLWRQVSHSSRWLWRKVDDLMP